MLKSFISLGVISLVWVFFGFSLSFGDSLKPGVIGNPLQYLFFNNIEDKDSNIPYLLFAIFQLKFAIITPAIITGSFLKGFALELFIIHGSFYAAYLLSF